MKKSEVARLLVYLSSVEGLEVTELQVETWHDALADVEFVDSMVAARDHVRSESRRMWPADIRRATVDSVGRDEWALRA